ncbi:MAG: hypothetical protein LBM94_05900 [Propionibacteriaceae bacterium]|jgi:hypothetical protein|nr:hypothetical protein [Propionibacteriaceae bacterium]
MTTIDPERYRYIPGVTVILNDDPIDALGLHDFDGNPITEESLAREEEEATARQLAALVPGGKSLSGGRIHSPVLRVVVSQDTAERVATQARSRNMSVSRYVRQIIEREVVAA